MAMNIGKVKQFSKHHPEDLVKDYDKMYDEIKERYAEHIKQGRLGFDDRTKLFHLAITEGWTEWLIVTYNQCRLGICCGCAGAAPGQPEGPPSGGYWWCPPQCPPPGGYWWCPPQSPPPSGWCPPQGPPPQGPPPSGWCPPQVPISAGEGGKPNCGCKQ